ncbi:specific histone demethylase 1 homolog 1 [Seminavis robusta]|uniref:Specific histone demethylase 1 homolog 1 n=1 Tax=Seminavis robusta TaxID=568900 RepID=A0A9N8EDY5_9STRA|nr:specific histone demethylase 1 homolog 1 [Seminavis robusta]|eukprot:Sro982_g227750.1 specific histone demethylase 1 homolog 1 (523) ;mRNA; f:34912-36654
MSPVGNQKKNGDDNNNNTIEPVVIIGAGWAGLSAAKDLLINQGIQAKILEGRPVMGGRCRTGVAEDGVTAIEYGPQWVHGVQAKNPIYQAALDAGVEMARSDYNSQIILQDHVDKPTTEASEERMKWMEDYLMEGKGGFWAYQERRQDKDNKDCSLRQAAEDFLDKIDATDEQRLWMWYLLDCNTAQEYAASLEDLSMFWWDSDEEMKGGDVYLTQDIHGGYKAVLEHFTKDFSQNIQYNSKVSAIDYSHQDRVVVTYTQDDGAVQTITAKKVIVTVPLGVLQKNIIQFTPDLPHDKQRAITRMGNGVLNKCIFIWEDSDADNLPWPADKEWIERMVTGKDPKQPQGLWTEFVNYQPINGRPVLCGFTVGRIAEQVEELSDQEIRDSAFDALKKMFCDTEIPEPKQVIITRWGDDEFTYGSYSFNAVGGNQSDHSRIAEGVNKKLYFAGEHCHLQYFGTCQGAYMSGTNAVKQLVRDANKGGAKKGKKKNNNKNKKGLLQERLGGCCQGLVTYLRGAWRGCK